MKQPYTLNNVSLNKNTQKTKHIILTIFSNSIIFKHIIDKTRNYADIIN